MRIVSIGVDVLNAFNSRKFNIEVGSFDVFVGMLVSRHLSLIVTFERNFHWL